MRKGVVQLSESILVTFFIIIIILMGIVVFYRFHLNSLHNYEQEYINQQLLSLLITLPNDFMHTNLGDSENAVDTSKLFYDNLDYGFKKIIIEQVYPKQDVVECKLQSYPNCNYFAVYNKENSKLKNKLVESRPVSLYSPLSKEYRAGKLTIYYYY